MPVRLDPDEIGRFTAATEARPNDLMDAATHAFAAMATAAARVDHDAAASAAVVVGDTCLQVCTLSAVTWEEAESKVRFLTATLGWAWPREPALGAVLEAARRAESAAWG